MVGKKKLKKNLKSFSTHLCLTAAGSCEEEEIEEEAFRWRHQDQDTEEENVQTQELLVVTKSQKVQGRK